MGDEEKAMSDVDLAEVFNEEVEEEPVAEVVETPQQEPPAVEEVVETEPTGEKEEVSTPEPKAEEESQTVPIAALMAERDKRKAAEQKWEQAQTEQNKEAPDVFEDQAGFTKHFEEKMETALFNQRANISEDLVRRERDDLDAKVERFNELKATNPQLVTQVQQASSPYHEIVDIVDNHERMEKLGDPKEFEATLRTKIEAEMREKIMGEVKNKAETEAKTRESIPTSLVKSSSKGSISGSTWGGPTSLEDAFGD